MNVEWLTFLPAFVRRGLYFLLQTMIGSNIYRIWKEFISWEKLPEAELRRRIDDKLGDLLHSASSQTEYYRTLSLSRRGGETAHAWLKRFPVLERSQVRDHFQSLVTDSLRGEIASPDVPNPSKYSWVIVKTGGTTGSPTTVVHDAITRDWGRVTRLYGQRQCGFPLGKRYIRLWGSEHDLLKRKAGLQQRVMHALHGEVALNAFRAREEDLRRDLEVMKSRPEIKNLMAYVDAAASLALFAREKNIEAPRYETIMACAGTVTPEYRKLLSETFSAGVFDKYGSRECSDMACECLPEKGLHVYSPHVFIEIVDDHGNECPPGKPGKILVTCLNNKAFPMIRYSIGDIGVWAKPGVCSCGCAWPRMEGITGRQDDMLLTADGTWQSSSFVRHFVGVSLNWQQIREWQLEQTGNNQFVFRYIPLSDSRLAENLKKLEESFHLVFGAAARIEMKKVAEIPPSASGKVRWILNSWKKQESR